MPRYVLHPGWIRKTKPDREFVGAERLAMLYGVDMDDCIVSDPSALGPMIYPRPDDIHLRPRPSGRYVLPKE